MCYSSRAINLKPGVSKVCLAGNGPPKWCRRSTDSEESSNDDPSGEEGPDVPSSLTVEGAGRPLATLRTARTLDPVKRRKHHAVDFSHSMSSALPSVPHPLPLPLLPLTLPVGAWSGSCCTDPVMCRRRETVTGRM